MRKPYRLLAAGALCAGLAVLGVTGCSSTKKETKETGQTKEQAKADKAVSQKVVDALNQAPDYKYPQVYVRTLNGVVLLSGTVNNEGQKQEAATLAQQAVPGHEVQNNLLIQPPVPTGRTDEQPQGVTPAPPPSPQPQP